MRQVGSVEAQNTLGSLLDRVEGGEEFLITRHGKPVARLVASSGGFDREQAMAAADRIRARAKQLPQDAITWEILRLDRDEARP